jgi:immune inhibitor A
MRIRLVGKVILQVSKLVLFTFCISLAMPPHPDLTRQIKEGKIALPDNLLHPNRYQERGIDSPVYRPVNSLYKKGTTPSGEFKPLVLLVDFSDNNFQVSPAYFDDLIFSEGPNSVRDYYREVSYGNLDIIPLNLPSEIGWIRVPETYQHYVDHQYGLGYYPHNSQRLVEDLVDMVDSLVDLSQYDNDSDGFVDALVVIHSGTGAEWNGNPDDIWSHTWSLPYPFKLSQDGVAVKNYTIQPEFWQNAGDMTVGVFCHELGHIFGLPDLYDLDGDSKGVGEWSVMAYGAWNGERGSSPAHPDAWSRIKLGFANPTLISENRQGMMLPAVQEVDAIYRLWTCGELGNEYFLVENRQRIGYDAHLPGSGLLIWHVDESMLYNATQWYPGCTHSGHYKVALKQADGLWQLEKNLNFGDNSDPYPGSCPNSSFNSTSFPNSKNYQEVDTYCAVDNISSSADGIICDFLVKPLDLKDETEQNQLPDFALKQNFPNPFNSSTIISFTMRNEHQTIKNPIHATLLIYNVLGQRVRTLINESKAEGHYNVVWDGKDDQGNDLAGGLYFYRLKTGNSQETKKMILLK